ncbi:MAG: trehalose-6-phosphate synthase, partial [Bacteroidota bacterium]
MNNIGDLKFNRLIIVAYRLPYKFIKKNDTIKAVQNSGGLVSAVLSLSQNIYNIHPEKEVQKIIWAGKGDAYLEKNKISSHKDFDLFPLYIPDHINDKFYGGFCNDMIWPLFHYFPDYTVFDTSYFKAYIKVTQLVSEQL